MTAKEKLFAVWSIASYALLIFALYQVMYFAPAVILVGIVSAVTSGCLSELVKLKGVRVPQFILWTLIIWAMISGVILVYGFVGYMADNLTPMFR